MWPAGPVWTATENLAFTGIWSLDRPAHSTLLYWLLSHVTFCTLLTRLQIELSLCPSCSRIRGVEVKVHQFITLVHDAGEIKWAVSLQKGICIWERQTVAKSWSLDSAAQELVLLHLPALLGPLGRYRSLQESESSGWNVLQVGSYIGCILAFYKYMCFGLKWMNKDQGSTTTQKYKYSRVSTFVFKWYVNSYEHWSPVWNMYFVQGTYKILLLKHGIPTEFITSMKAYL